MVVMLGLRVWYILLFIFIDGLCALEDTFKNLLIVNPDNFVDFFNQRDVGDDIFIMFYSREGSWSKIALGEFDKVAGILSKTKVKFGAICPDDNYNFPVNIDLVQVPSIFHVHGKQSNIYRGTISHIEIMNWVLLKIVKDFNINTIEALDSVLNVPKSHEALSLIVSKNQNFSISKFIENPSVVSLASLCIFFYVVSPVVIERLEGILKEKLIGDDRSFLDSGMSYVVVLREFEYKNDLVIYKKSLDDIDSMVKFIKYESIPILVEANSRMLPRLVEYGYKIVFIYTQHFDFKPTVSVEKIFHFFSNNHYDCVLVHLSPNTITDDPIIRMLGIDKDSKIVVRAIWRDDKTGKIRKYQPQNFSESTFDYKQFFTFMRKLIYNELKPYFKSLPSIPRDIDTGPVKTIVGSDFYDRVLNSEEDVMLMIYATWCGHCHKLRPLWRQLGLLLQNVKNILVAKLDGVNNEVDDIYITYFPTIRMYPHGNKSHPIDFKLEVTIENLLEFAEKTAGIAKINSSKLTRISNPEPLFEKSEL